jgi:hypothetical protein
MVPSAKAKVEGGLAGMKPGCFLLACWDFSASRPAMKVLARELLAAGLGRIEFSWEAAAVNGVSNDAVDWRFDLAAALGLGHLGEKDFRHRPLFDRISTTP